MLHRSLVLAITPFNWSVSTGFFHSNLSLISKISCVCLDYTVLNLEPNWTHGETPLRGGEIYVGDSGNLTGSH